MLYAKEEANKFRVVKRIASRNQFGLLERNQTQKKLAVTKLEMADNF